MHSFAMPPCGPTPPRNLGYALLVLVVAVQLSSALVTKAELPWEIQDCYNWYSHYSLRDIVGETVCWTCESPVIGRLRTSDVHSKVIPSTNAYIRDLMKKLNDLYRGNGFAHQTTRKCRRKEYRMMTDGERNRYHTAINALKQNTTVFPNKYDVIASLHTGTVLRAAHRGPAFLGWHRAYLLIYEWELQIEDQSVCLPYWDSSLDSRLANPVSSNVFSSDFMGGRGTIGEVVDGPFAGWRRRSGDALRRAIGASGELYTPSKIGRILSQRRTRDITEPNGDPQNGLEFHHNGVHNFIGGWMRRLRSAAYDPAFFLHHCYVDYIWEVFRDQQRANGTDPQRDYPGDVGRVEHRPDRVMVEFERYGLDITNIQAYADNMTSTYEYDPSPTCSFSRPTCGSKYLQCNFQFYGCIPIDPVTAVAAGLTDSTQERRPPMPIQNSYCIDDHCDAREWVYIPVEVVSIRSPELHIYESYPVYNASTWKVHDIYQPSAYPDTYQYINGGHPKGYDKCYDGNGIGQIYIQSNGLSYDGFYKESVIIDQRLSTSIAVGYIAVKDPKNKPVKALFRAFDFCGRICKTAYKIAGTRNYEPFSGVLDVQDIPGFPKEYSQTYGEATLKTYDYSSNKEYPSFIEDDIVLRFYCDYTEEIPWANKVEPPMTINVPAVKPIITPAPSPSAFRHGCKIDNECTIDVPCKNNLYCMGERYKCRKPCKKRVECYFGKYWKI